MCAGPLRTDFRPSSRPIISTCRWTTARGQFMQDGVLFGVSPSGRSARHTEFRAPNWWMGMFTRSWFVRLTLNTMFSLDGDRGTLGYGRDISRLARWRMTAADRQAAPHDLFMQNSQRIWAARRGDRAG